MRSHQEHIFTRAHLVNKLMMDHSASEMTVISLARLLHCKAWIQGTEAATVVAAKLSTVLRARVRDSARFVNFWTEHEEGIILG
jgi:hypothetical protein